MLSKIGRNTFFPGISTMTLKASVRESTEWVELAELLGWRVGREELAAAGAAGGDARLQRQGGGAGRRRLCGPAALDHVWHRPVCGTPPDPEMEKVVCCIRKWRRLLHKKRGREDGGALEFVSRSRGSV